VSLAPITLGSAVTYTVVHKGISTTQLSIHCNTTAHSRQPRVQHFACNFQRLVNFLGVLPMDLFAGGANLIQQELLVQPSGSTRNFRWYWKDEVDALTLAAGCPDKTSRTESPWQHLVSGVKVNPLDSKGNYNATLNNTKLVHWPLMHGLLYLVQQGGAWAAWGPTHSPRCIKCSSPPINGQCTNHSIAIWWSLAVWF